MVGKIFGEDEIGSAARAAANGEIVHESAHQKETASRGAEQVFLGERIGDVLQIETASFVEDMYDHLAAIQFDDQLNFLLAVLAISVVVSVDDAFAHGHADLVDFVLGEAGFFGCAHHEVFGHVHAFQTGFERHVQTPGFWSWWSHWGLNMLSMGTIARRMASMRRSMYEPRDLTVVWSVVWAYLTGTRG